MTIELSFTFNPNRTLASLDSPIEITWQNDTITVTPDVAHVMRRVTPRLVWKSDEEFMLDFKKMGNSPSGNGQYIFRSKFKSGEWQVAVMLKDVVYKTTLKYDVVNSHGTLDPALIIDPN